MQHLRRRVITVTSCDAKGFEIDSCFSCGRVGKFDRRLPRKKTARNQAWINIIETKFYSSALEQEMKKTGREPMRAVIQSGVVNHLLFL